MVQLIRDNFSNSQKTQFGATVPIYGVPVALNGSYASNLYDQFLEQTGVKWNQTTNIETISSSLGKNAVEAYKICTQGQQRSGPRILVYDSTAAQITVAIRYISGVNAPTQDISWRFSWSGDTPQNSWPDSNYTNNESRINIYDREPRKDFRLTATIGGETDTVTIPYVPKIEVNRSVTSWETDIKRLANDGSGRSQGPISDCRIPRSGEVFDTDATEVLIDLKVGNLDSRTYARKTQNTSTKICWEAFLYPLSSEGGGDFRYHVVLSQHKTPI